MVPLPGVLLHTKNIRPRGRSLAWNPWLPHGSHETVSQMNHKNLNRGDPCFVLHTFTAFLSDYQTGSQEAEALLAGLSVRGERGCGILGSRQQSIEPWAVQPCDCHCWGQVCPVCVANNVRCLPKIFFFPSLPCPPPPQLNKDAVAYWIWVVLKL